MRSIRLFRRELAGGSLQLELQGDIANGPVNKVVLTTTAGADTFKATLTLRDPLSVATSLVHTGSDGTSRIEEQPPSDPAKTAGFRKDQAQLRKVLLDLALSADASARFFDLGARALAGLEGSLTLRVPALADSADRDDGPLLQASAIGTLRVAVQAMGGAQATAKVSLQVSLSERDIEAGHARALHGVLDIGGAELKGLRLRWPDLHLPRLSFDGLALDGPDLKGFGLPIPSLQVGLIWTTAPAFAITLTDGHLQIVTGLAGQALVGVGLTPGEQQALSNRLLDIQGLALTFDSAGVSRIDGTFTSQGSKTTVVTDETIDVGPVKMRLAQVEMAPLATFSPAAGLSVELLVTARRLEIRATEDPSLVLALSATVKLTVKGDGTVATNLTDLAVIEPYPVKLIEAAASGVADAFRLVAGIDLSTPDVGLLAVLDRIGAILSSAVLWMAQRAAAAAGAVGRVLAGLAEAAADALAQFLHWLRQGTPSGWLTGIAIELRLDPCTLALQQIILMPAAADTSAAGDFTYLGDTLTLSLPVSARPSLIVDLRGEGFCALVATLPAGSGASLKTDLWLARASGSSEAIRESDATGRPTERLIQVAATVDQPLAIALIAVEGGQLRLFGQLKAAASTERIAVGANVALGFGATLSLADLDWSLVKAKVAIASDAKDRLLPFLRGSDSAAGPAFSQHIKIVKMGDAAVVDGAAELPLEVEIIVAGETIGAQLVLALDLRTLRVRFSGGEVISIKGKRRDTDLLGMKLSLLAKDAKAAPGADFEQFVLDFSDGDARLSLSKEARGELSYAKVASAGRGLVFDIETFAVSRDGLDLQASIMPDPVQLAGVGTPFRFTSGGVSIRRSKLLSASLAGVGQLPPALVGEASAEVAISLGRGKDDGLVVEAAKGFLKPGAPLICEGTRFRFQIDELGFAFVEQDGGYLFYFLLTGEARFKPGDSEFQSGLLANLAKTRIILKRAPLAGEAGALLRAIEFQTPIDPPVSAKLFDLFSFKIRGIGFHPASDAFGGSPAMSISGQIGFVPSGDVPNVKIDFHELMIAPPESGGSMPRVRLDGLGVEVKAGGLATISGRAIAVDRNTPSLNTGIKLPNNVTAQGFLASGHLEISSLASVTASLGFLELRERLPDGRDSDPRHAFFVYGQMEKLSYPINIFGYDIFLEEIGFGFGFRYTLAAMAEADRVTTPEALVRVLDSVASYQGNLADFKSWQPETDGDRLTMAMRIMMALSAASLGGVWDEDREKAHPSNPVLFDLVAGIRSDLTFLLMGRAWLCVTYYDWIDDGAQSELPDGWKERPSLKGYLYLSIPRQMMLARLVADPKGVVGNRPPLFAPLKEALTNIEWSSTLYVTPGLFHQEFGWPYELAYTVGNESGDFAMTIRGGLVLRIEDGAMLYGAALRAKGFAQFSGSFGGGSFGASARARADFALDSKFIAYISVRDRSRTLFYGALRLDVSISFEIHVWLDIPLPFDNHIHLEAGFSLSLSLSFAVEVAAQPDNPYLGGRATASIRVSALGRSLSIGVGLSFNNDFLVEARQRCARFLELGLAAQTPEPAAGLAAPAPAPQPEAARSHRTETVDRAIEAEADHQALVTAQPEVLAAELIGTPIGRTDWWAMVFPTRIGGADGYVLQLVPRDLQKCYPSDVPARPADPPVADGPPLFRDATFFAPPPKNVARAWDHRLQWHDGVGRSMLRLLPDGRSQSRAPTGGVTDTDVVWTTLVAGEASGLHATLADVQAKCFFAGPPTGDDRPAYTEPLPAPTLEPIGKLKPLAGSADAAVQDLARRARTRAAATGPARVAFEIDERRSSLIAAVGETASRIAASGEIEPGAWSRRFDGVDARDYGLTFLVGAADIDLLFDAGNKSTPPRAKFDLTTCLEVFEDGEWREAQTDAGEVHLFNPPSRHFVRAQPILAAKRATVGAPGIMLEWDLEPTWGGLPEGPYGDPEFQLKHYRIERRIPEFDLVTRTTVKPADQAYQFVDDLKDLPPEMRALLLGLPLQDLPQNAVESARAKLAAVGHDLEIQYQITPMDIAGTLADATPMEAHLALPAHKLPTLAEARLEVRYAEIASVDRLPANLISLQVRWTSDDEVIPATPGPLDLRVRAERVVGAGLYGADALVDVAGRPSIEALEEARPSDAYFRLTPGTAGPGSEALRAALLTPKEEAQYTPYAALPTGDQPIGLRAALGIGKGVGVEAVRVYVRRPGGPWRPVDIVVAVAASQPSVSPPALEARQLAVESPVELFEHPVTAEFCALDFVDLGAEAGRLHLVTANATTTLETLIDHADVAVIPDPERRSGVRLRWNTAASSLALTEGAASGADLARLVGGFDLFTLQADALPPAAPADADLTGPAKDKAGADHMAAHADYLGRVQLLPQSLAAFLPAGIGDLAKVEASFPSEAKLRAPRRTDPSTAGTTAAGPASPPAPAWYSTAESLLAWPPTLMRRSLAPAPDEADLAMLFGAGRPTKMSADLMLPIALGAEVSEPVLTPESAAASSQTGAVAAGDVGPLSVDQVRRWLRRLVWTRRVNGDPEEAYVDEFFADSLLDPKVAWQTAELRIVATYASGATKEVRMPLPIAAGLHPVLADVLDEMRYVATMGGKLFRRYEPVLERIPPFEAKSLAAFMDETAEGGDPHGFAALRGLGLAVALRIFDTETGEFLIGEAMLREVRRAYEAVLGRYSGASRLGAPFVDVFARHEGLSCVGSFDGGVPGADLKGEYLSFVQIALRPIAEPLQNGGVGSLVRYGRLTRSGDGPASIDTGAAHGVVDLEILHGPRRGARMTVATTGLLRDGSPSGLSVDEAAEAAGREFADGEVVGIVRIVATQDGPSQSFFQGLTLEPIDRPETLLSDCPNPFGRFAPLDPDRIAALLYTDDPTPRAKALHRNLLRLAVRFSDDDRTSATPDGYPAANVDAAHDVAARLENWSRRFVRYGPAIQPAQLEIPVSLACVPRPNPWRVIARTDGTADVLLLEKDRWGARRRYAVRPFGRYETFVEALQRTKPGVPVAQPSLAGALDGRLDAWAEVCLPRTEPVGAPVVLSARRLDKSDSSVVRPRDQLELVVARAADESLAEANSAVDAAAQPHGLGVSFWAEHAQKPWAISMGVSEADERDALIGAGGQTPKPLPLTLADLGQQTDLDNRVPDLWRGAVVYRTQHLPHFLRVHALAFSAAGAVVSPTSTATFEESAYALAFPARSDVWDSGTAPLPKWGVSGMIEGRVDLAFEVPLVRYVDGMTRETFALWGDRTKPLLRTPDPSVSYRISLDAGAEGIVVSTSAELEIASRPAGPGGPFRVEHVGPRFATTPNAVTLRTQDGIADCAVVGLAVLGSAPEPQLPPYTSDAGLGDRFTNLRLDLAGAKTLAPFAPTAAAAIVLMRPPATFGLVGLKLVNTTDWRSFRGAASEAAASLQPYLPLAGDPPGGFGEVLKPATTLLRRAAAIRDGDDGEVEWHALLVDPGLGGHAEAAGQVYRLPVAVWPAGVALPHRPQADLAIGGWTWPAPPPANRDARVGLARILSGAQAVDPLTAAQAANAANVLVATLRPMLRARQAAGLRARPVAGFAPLTAGLAGDVEVAAFGAVAELPDAWDILWQVKVDPPQLTSLSLDPDRLTLLFRVVETLPTAASAIEALGAWEDGAGPLTTVVLPIPFRNRDAIVQRLRDALAVTDAAAQLGCTVADPQGPFAAFQSRPPTDDELDAIAAGVVRARLADIAADQLFGTDRRPAVTAYHGVASPKRETLLRRKEVLP